MSSRKISEIADQNVFDKLRLGVTNLPLGNAKISNSSTSQNIFNQNLKKYMLDKGQFNIGENEISVKSVQESGNFSTEFLLPSNSYQGKYYVRYFIFQNGEFLSYAENELS